MFPLRFPQVELGHPPPIDEDVRADQATGTSRVDADRVAPAHDEFDHLIFCSGQDLVLTMVLPISIRGSAEDVEAIPITLRLLACACLRA